MSHQKCAARSWRGDSGTDQTAERKLYLGYWNVQLAGNTVVLGSNVVFDSGLFCYISSIKDNCWGRGTKRIVWNKVLCTLATVPSGYPERVEVPQPFLEQINTPLCIWLVRVLVITAFVVCLLYARHTRPANECSEKEESAAEPQTAQSEQREGEK